MLGRFSGEDGKRKLVELFAQQELVHNNTIAVKLADIADTQNFQKNDQLYVRGQPGKNFLYFVLSGSFDLSVEDKHVAILKSGQAVGEFPIVNPELLNYTVTVRALEQSEVALVTEEQFIKIAKDYPEEIWKNMAKMLVTRLYNTNESQQGLSSSKAIKPGDRTIRDWMKELTVPELWKIIVAIIVALSAVATVAYKIGTGAW